MVNNMDKSDNEKIEEIIKKYESENIVDFSKISLKGKAYVNLFLEHEYREVLEKTKEELIRKNRYFSDDSFNKNLSLFVDDCRTSFKPGTVFFRSRIYNEPDKEYRKKGVIKSKDLVFKGYDATDSFINEKSEWPTYGRMNPSGIMYLYVSSDYKTSMKEVNPSYGELVSVAEIVNTEELVIADFTKGISVSKNTYLAGLFNELQKMLSEGSSEKDYIFPQYVAAFCKNRGFDGIGFKSKYQPKNKSIDNEGINYTIFNYQKCKACSSKLYYVKQVSLAEEEID